jgi:hypothetical protein
MIAHDGGLGKHHHARFTVDCALEHHVLSLSIAFVAATAVLETSHRKAAAGFSTSSWSSQCRRRVKHMMFGRGNAVRLATGPDVHHAVHAPSQHSKTSHIICVDPCRCYICTAHCAESCREWHRAPTFLQASLQPS